MKQMWKLALLASLAATPAIAQAPADPLTSALKRQWDGIALNLREAAEKMPEDKYSFRPSPDVRTYAGEVGHGVFFNYVFCARIKGEPNPNKVEYEKETSKATLVKGMIASNDYCSALFSTANDKWLMELVGQGPQAQPRAAVLSSQIAHANETYGTMVPYLRMSGIVPPSTARTKKP